MSGWKSLSTHLVIGLIEGLGLLHAVCCSVSVLLIGPGSAPARQVAAGGGRWAPTVVHNIRGRLLGTETDG